MKNSRQENNKRAKKRINQKLPEDFIGTTVTLPKSAGFIVPDKMRTNLRYWKAPVADLTTPLGLIRFLPTGLADIDPVASGTTPSGFEQWAGFYFSYRVLSSKIIVTGFCSAENTMIKLMAIPVNVDPGAVPSAGYVTSLPENNYFKSKNISPGGPAVMVTNEMSTEKMYGSRMTRFDDNFSSLTNNIPANNWFWVVAWYNLATVPSSTPLILNVEMQMEVEFYDRRILPRGSSPLNGISISAAKALNKESTIEVFETQSRVGDTPCVATRSQEVANSRSGTGPPSYYGGYPSSPVRK